MHVRTYTQYTKINNNINIFKSNLAGMVIYTFNFSTWKVETGGSENSGHSWLYSEFKASPEIQENNTEK